MESELRFLLLLSEVEDEAQLLLLLLLAVAPVATSTTCEVVSSRGGSTTAEAYMATVGRLCVSRVCEFEAAKHEVVASLCGWDPASETELGSSCRLAPLVI